MLIKFCQVGSIGSTRGGHSNVSGSGLKAVSTIQIKGNMEIRAPTTNIVCLHITPAEFTALVFRLFITI